MRSSAAINPAFLSPLNISNTLTFTVELGLIALAMTLLMTAGEFDLSVGSVFGFAPVVMWTLYNAGLTSLFVGFVVALLISAVIGLFNGLFVTRLKIPSFLVTLGMLLVVRGIALFVTDGFPAAHLERRRSMARRSSGRRFLRRAVPRLRVAVLVHRRCDHPRLRADAVEIRQLDPGHRRQCGGGAGARRQRQRASRSALFVLSAVMSAFAGIISSIRTSAANPNSGTGYELEVIAMVVIGGTALTGGRGTIIGTVLGILILRVMRNGIVLIGVPGLAYNIFIGAIILGMMALHSWLERRHQAGT